MEFNIEQLYNKAISLCPSAASIQSCQKLEGGFSKAFAKPNRGPCLTWDYHLWSKWKPMTVLGRSLSEYASVLIDAGLGRVPPPEQLMGELQKPFQGSVDEHFRLLHTGSIALQQLVNNTHIQNNKAPTMFHSDVH